MVRIIIFASGSGSNAENIIKYFSKKDTVTIVQVKDINGVTFTPLAANADYVITVNPTPAKPVINF